MKRTLGLACSLLLVAFIGLASAQEAAPKLINYQGKLTDAVGAPLGGSAGGTYSLKFEVFDAPTGGTAAWGETRQVAVVDGVFNVVLGGAGGTNTFGDLGAAFAGKDRYLQTTVMPGAGVATQQVLLPRQQLASVPFSLVALHGVPPGTVVPYAGSGPNAPEGWEFCHGQTLNGSEPKYAPLWNAIKTTYGGTGQNSFLVPDLRGRTTIGAGQGQGLTSRSLSAKIGAETHTLTADEMPLHNHNVRDLGHTHSYTTGQGRGVDNGSGLGVQDDVLFDGDRNTGQGSANIAQDSRGGNQPHNNMQPSLVLNYIIKL